MASLSDQIDRLTRTTRALKEIAVQIAPHSNNHPVLFTNAVLNSHLGDLIRDVDPSELGLFRLVQNTNNTPYDNAVRTGPDPEIRRTQFPGATPLRKNTTRREDRQEIDPEVYAHAALKYIDQYEPIRPMPRAYDQIVAVLNKIHAVREKIESLNNALEQAIVNNTQPPSKVRVEQEERRIKELQSHIEELSKKKESLAAAKKSAPSHPTKNQEQNNVVPQVSSVSSPQEEKFWTTPGEPSRVLRFSENLLDEEVNLGDISTASFGSPIPGSSELKPVKLFGEFESVDREANISLDTFENGAEDVTEAHIQDEPINSTSPPLQQANTPESMPTILPDEPESKPTIKDSKPETPSTRQRKIKVNIEVERIVSKIWSTVGDIIMLPSHLPAGTTPSANDTILHLQQLASQSPLPESPLISTVSSISGEGSTAPTFQQIQTAYLLIMLLSASPSYSLPLNQVKDNLALKSQGSGQGTTRVLFGCVAKRLVKIDRGGREQIVKFDI